MVVWFFWTMASWSAEPVFRESRLSVDKSGNPGFTRLDPTVTGVSFSNVFQGDAYLTNAVAHNGAGVALGDVDGDGRVDLFFCSLQGPNRLYQNLGNWRFKEIDAGEAACAGQISTGAALADVDGDGDLDLLVNGIAAGTRLFLNDGKGGWTEQKDSGLSRTASATSMALADIDGDGDLDLYCTHFIDVMLLADPTTRFAVAKKGDRWEVTRVNGESARMPRWKDRFEALADGKVRELPEVHGLYRNEGNGHFKAIQFEPGVYLNEQGTPIQPHRDWGLAAMFRDMNGDGVPDLYVCNDNTSPDRIWINTGKGNFRAIEGAKIRHTSRSSMGVDFADLNRDGWDDFMVVDMLARPHAKRMTQLVRDRPSPEDYERIDARLQFNRNTLFLGRPDGSYGEVALMAGVAATDWSWTPIFMDVDLDGYEDLLITNGFEFDVMDQDGHDELKNPKRRLSEAELKRHMQFLPKWRTRNAAFRNRGDGTFEPADHGWGFDHLGVSFGMAQADLDGDGDLDLVVNNLNESAGLYRNNGGGHRVAVRLRGLAPNTHGIGARLRLSGGSLSQAQEMICAGRYLSSDEAVRVFAADPDTSRPMRLEVRWRSGAVSVVASVKADCAYEVMEPTAAGADRIIPAPVAESYFADVSSLLDHLHVDADFDEAARQPSLPARLNRLGPGVGWFDLDGDGWEDLHVAGGRNGTLAVFLNEQGRRFRKIEGATNTHGGQGSIAGWNDGLGNRSILVASVRDEPGETSVVVASGSTNLTLRHLLATGTAAIGPMACADIDADGDLDLFIGGRFQPSRFPESPPSLIWVNDHGKLSFDRALSEAFQSAGMVSGATFVDLDGDGDADLALATDWGPVRIFENQRGQFVEATASWGLAGVQGRWASVVAGDFDGDGRMDLACGNRGRNTIYELYQPASYRLFYGDWKGNGALQILEAAKSGDDWLPMRDRKWLERDFPDLATRFPTHEAFGRATVRDLLGVDYAKTPFKEISQLASCVFLNRGGKFEVIPLPAAAQTAPAFALSVADFDADGIEDLFVGQNDFGADGDLTREDGGEGLWLKGTGNGGFKAVEGAVSGIRIHGQQRGAAVVDFNHDGRVDLAVSQNNASTKLYMNRSPKRGLRVSIQGLVGNPDGAGAQLRVIYSDGRKGPCRAIQAGSGFGSLDASAQVLGWTDVPVAVWIRWPGGRERVVPIQDVNTELRITFEP